LSVEDLYAQTIEADEVRSAEPKPTPGLKSPGFDVKNHFTAR
jgi:hypothetical protein